MLPVIAAPFWTDPLSSPERSLIYYFLVIAGLALFAQFVRTWTSLNEIGPRYRPAMLASLGVTGVAFLSYIVLVVKFDVGYSASGDMWTPNRNAIWSWAPRFMDWSVTVPLLMVQLVAVSTLVGAAAARMRTVTMACAFLMIFTGYLGGVVIDSGTSVAALWTWGVISGVFMVVLYVCIITMLVRARRSIPGARSTRTFTSASVLLLVVWFVYPIVFGFQGYTDHSGGWAVGAQIALSVADITAKVGYGALIHKIAKLRSAEEIAEGEPHPEAVWISGEKQASAALPPVQDDRAEARRVRPVEAEPVLVRAAGGPDGERP